MIVGDRPPSSMSIRSDMHNFDLHTTLGALAGGVILANLLFGVFTLQVHIYYKKYPHDRRSLKILVAVIWWVK